MFCSCLSLRGSANILLSYIMSVFENLNSCRDLMNEGIFDIVTDALQSQDKKLVLTG